MEFSSDPLCFERVCRTCMQQQNEETVVLLSIYEFLPGLEQNKNILELLRNATPQLIIQETDSLPKKICKQCIDQIKMVHQFQEMAISSDCQMRSFLEYGTMEAKFSEMRESATDVFEIQAELPDPLHEIQATDLLTDQFKVEITELDEKVELSSNMDADYEPDNINNSSSDSSDSSDDDSDAEIMEKPSVALSIVKKPASSKKTLNVKQEKANEEHNNESPDCNELLKGGKLLREHIRSNHKVLKKAFACSLCERSYTKSCHVRRHERKKHNIYKRNKEDDGIKPYACPECNCRYMQQSHLRRHMVQKHCGVLEPEEDPTDVNPEGYRCDECPRRFAKPESLRMHKRSHDKPIDYTCETCRQTFKAFSTYVKHKQTHVTNEQNNGINPTSDPKKPFVCEYCNKAFQQTCTLKDHLRTHTGEQPFLCSECGKSFNSSSNLKQHLLRHAGIKRYECPDCPKKFPCLSDLASHKAVHKKYKPHVCDVCGACFGKPYQLKVHKMYHNGEKPHKCEYCEMRFVCADHMRRHMRTHTGEKPYKCKYCERAFAQSNDLIKHLRSHLGENVYRCELCPQAFRLATELREHFAEHKNDDEETRQRNLIALKEDEEQTKLKVSLSKKVQTKKQCNIVQQTITEA